MVSADGVGLPSGMGFIGLSMPEADMSGGIISPPFYLYFAMTEVNVITSCRKYKSSAIYMRKESIYLYINAMCKKTIKRQLSSIMSDAYIELL